MKRFAVLSLIGICGCGVSGSGGGTSILPLPVPVVLPVPAGALFDTAALLEGHWVVSDAAGARSCLVIQELRVSIVDASCSNDGSGVSSRIIDAPTITRAGDVIVLRVTYNLRADTDRVLRLIFTGQLQSDGNFVGSRRDEDLTEAFVIPDRFAIMSRI